MSHGGISLHESVPAILAGGFFDALNRLQWDAPAAAHKLMQRTEKGGRTEDCGTGAMCFYDQDGNLDHWTRLYQGMDEPVTGFASIKRQQEQYNRWARAESKFPYFPYPQNIPETGGLTLQTLQIPGYKASFKIGRQWHSLLDACGDDCPMNIQMASYEDYARWPGDYPFPNKQLKTRAEAIRAATLAARAFQGLVRSLEPLTRKWAALKAVEGEHLEPSQLPEGFLVELGAAQKEMEEAVTKSEIISEVYKK